MSRSPRSCHIPLNTSVPATTSPRQRYTNEAITHCCVGIWAGCAAPGGYVLACSLATIGDIQSILGT
jgi:hypothetical protein